MRYETFEHQGNTLSYSIGGESNAQTVVLLPPGIGDSRFCVELSSSLESRFQVVVIDFPGVNTSHFAHSNSIRGVARVIVALLKQLNAQNPIVVGASYGGSVAVEMSSQCQLKKLILLYSGEYWSITKKVLYSLFFVPSLVSHRLRMVIAKKLTRHQYFDFRNYSDPQLRQFCERWVDVLWYSLPRFRPNGVPTTIVHSSSDDVVRKKSLEKLMKLFPNHTVVETHETHFKSLETLHGDGFGLVVDLLSTL